MSADAKAAPTVKQVTIMGETAVGGTVSGSYIYQNADVNPEGESVFCWYSVESGNEVIATTVDLALTAEHEGLTIQFSVIPVAVSGEEGDETFSDPKKVTSARYQNISEEESENSFFKQRGQFAFHAIPNDHRGTSTAGAYALKNRVTQNVSVMGTQNFGGVVPPEIASYLKNNSAITMSSTINSFCALVPVGSTNHLLVWGPGMPANLPDLQGIKSVYTNNASAAFIYSNPVPGTNTIGAVGTAATGGVVPIEIQNKLLFDKPVAIHSTYDAFAVRTESGKVMCWGNATNGGSIPANIQTQLDNMKVARIIASNTAFCALTDDGELIGWGKDGVIPALVLTRIYDDDGAFTVIANAGAFCAITNRRKKLLTWGTASYGGTMSEATAALAARGNIVLCVATPWAMCFINESGGYAAWGYLGYGGLESSQSDAEAAFEQGDTKAQIENLFKGIQVSAASRKSRVFSKLQTTAGGDIQLMRNDSSFVLLARHPDGRTELIHSWGLLAAGGEMPSSVKQVLQASHIIKIHASNGAYAALCNQGSVQGAVVTWGRSNIDGGTIPAHLLDALSSDVVDINTIQAFPRHKLPRSPHSLRARKTINMCHGAPISNRKSSILNATDAVSRQQNRV
ncbi:hypothetical protein PYV50_12735 [Pseudomonas sp. H22_DOA]|nr:hypothetical protein PYV50_12735 [Pseudomonas sp. H22_DOA]